MRPTSRDQSEATSCDQSEAHTSKLRASRQQEHSSNLYKVSATRKITMENAAAKMRSDSWVTVSVIASYRVSETHPLWASFP